MDVTGRERGNESERGGEKTPPPPLNPNERFTLLPNFDFSLYSMIALQLCLCFLACSCLMDFLVAYVDILLEHLENALAPGLADAEPGVQETDARRPEHHVGGHSGGVPRPREHLPHHATA